MDPQNPYQPYTTQNVDWERQQQAARDAEQRRFQENMRNIERSQNTAQATFGGSVGTRAKSQPTFGRRSRATSQAKGGRGLWVLGGVLGFFLAGSAGISVLGGIILGVLAGALLVPVLRLARWTAIKVIGAVVILYLVVQFLGALSGN